MRQYTASTQHNGSAEHTDRMQLPDYCLIMTSTYINCGVWGFTLDGIISSHDQCAINTRNAGVSLRSELSSIDRCSADLTIAIRIPYA